MIGRHKRSSRSPGNKSVCCPSGCPLLPVSGYDPVYAEQEDLTSLLFRDYHNSFHEIQSSMDRPVTTIIRFRIPTGNLLLTLIQRKEEIRELRVLPV